MKSVSKKTTVKKIVLIIFSVIFLSGIVTYSTLRENSLKMFDAELLAPAHKNIVILDNSGAEIDNSINSELADSNLIPAHLKDAIVSIEDKKFYQHNGVDYLRIAGAMFSNIKNGKIVQGGSTISQQLIKNTHLTNEKKFSRKINEYFLSKKLERLYNKDEILNMYMNIVYYGNETYGIANASKLFFDKPYTELTLEESATLAAVLNSPRIYSPLYCADNSIKRRNLVISEMFKDGKISEEEYKAAIDSPMNISKKNINNNETQINNVYCRAALIEAHDISCGKLDNCKIYTNYDADSQRALFTAMRNKNYYLPNKSGNVPEAQGIIINNSDGKIEAYYCSLPILKNLKRQPASAIKPILVYAPAIEKGIITPATPILDEEINFGGYSPKNHNNKYSGYVSTRQALSNSLNVPAVKVFDYTGIDYCKNFAKKAGVYFDENDKGYALSLGGFTNGLTLKETANTYQCLANDGRYIEAGMVEKITDAYGKTIYSRDLRQTNVMSQDTAYLVTDMLKSSVYEGTASRLASTGIHLAAKTGTAGNSLGNSDAYCFACTKDRTFAVWQGNISSYDNNMDVKVNGGSYPAMQLRDTIKAIYKTKNTEDFKRPESIIRLNIDRDELIENQRIIEADEYTRQTVSELFSANKMPQKRIVSRTTAPSDGNNQVNNDFFDEKNKNLIKILIDFFAVPLQKNRLKPYI